MKRLPKPASMTLNLAPMVDVMMCLIIFFLIASRLATAHSAVDLPWAISAKVVEAGELGNPVTITVRRAQGSDEQAEYVVTDWDGRRVTERVLRPEEVETLLKVRAARAVQENQTPRCVVRADRLVMYQHVEVVLRACGNANIAHIIFPAQKGADPEDAG